MAFKLISLLFVGAFFFINVQLFSVGRTLQGREVGERVPKTHRSVEIVALCAQKCGGVDEDSHSLSVEPVGHPDYCRHVCNVTTVKRSRRHIRLPDHHSSREVERT